MIRIFKTIYFSKWAKKEKIDDKALFLAVKEMQQGLIDADLGGNIYKKRIPIRGQGKSCGARAILAFQENKNVFFIFGFAKSEKANISSNELIALKILAKEVLGYNDINLNKAINAGELLEVQND